MIQQHYITCTSHYNWAHKLRLIIKDSNNQVVCRSPTIALVVWVHKQKEAAAMEAAAKKENSSQETNDTR